MPRTFWEVPSASIRSLCSWTTRLISDAGLLLCATLADVSPPCSSGATVNCCASRLSAHESLCARLGNSEDEQAGNCCRAGAEGPSGKVVVRDGEHGGIGELAENVRWKVSSKYLAVLASLHEVGKDLIDWSR